MIWVSLSRICLSVEIRKKNWPDYSSNYPYVIAGPCSAETEEQVITIAKKLKEDERIKLFRAGVWKPRTRPGSFEGNGVKALPWLKRVQEEIELPVTIEVATLQHVEESLKAGIDVLWIGARTTANPFAVQQIADALRGVDIPVLIKNPVNPDVALWLGAIERINKSGIEKIGAIHRGVSQFNKTLFRNNPEWQMAIELREFLPDILLLNDPSHITGNRNLVASVAQKAIDLKFDGLMIETHNDPDNAWSDAAQQVTPESLFELLDHLVIRSEKPKGVEIKSIEELRSSINSIDNQIIDLLGYRMKVVEDIARFKAANQMTIFQESRWNDLLDKHLKNGQLAGLSSEFVARVFRAIHQESIDKQSKVINNEKEDK